VPVEEAETAIARANGAPVLAAATVPVANGLPLSRDPSAAQVGTCYMPLKQAQKHRMLPNVAFTQLYLGRTRCHHFASSIVRSKKKCMQPCSAASGMLQTL